MAPSLVNSRAPRHARLLFHFLPFLLPLFTDIYIYKYATSGGGAAGSEVLEASERAGASGTSGEATGGDDSGDGRPARQQRGGRTGFNRRWRAARSR